MKDETIEDQNELIELIETTEFDVLEVDTKEHEFTRKGNQKIRNVSIEITASRDYDEDDGFENPYRVK